MPHLDWTTDELILAFDVVRSNGGRAVRSRDPRALDLSRVLRSLPIHPVDSREANFRSPESVQRKTFDIETGGHGYTGVRTKGSQSEKLVREWFDADPAGMAAAASRLRKLADEPSTALHDLTSSPLPESEEGGLLLRLHFVRERDPRLRARKLADVARTERGLACQICDFEFGEFYGDRGSGFLEVHHVVPLHVGGPRATKLDDLAAVCSNCHRMLHRRPQVTPAELRRQLAGGPRDLVVGRGSSTAVDKACADRADAGTAPADKPAAANGADGDEHIAGRTPGSAWWSGA